MNEKKMLLMWSNEQWILKIMIEIHLKHVKTKKAYKLEQLTFYWTFYNSKNQQISMQLTTVQ